MPHIEPRDYYVTLRRGKRTALLAGPFSTHSEALALVEPARVAAETIDSWSHFDSCGTASMPVSAGNPAGKLNKRLGVTPRSLLRHGCAHNLRRMKALLAAALVIAATVTTIAVAAWKVTTSKDLTGAGEALKGIQCK